MTFKTTEVQFPHFRMCIGWICRAAFCLAISANAAQGKDANGRYENIHTVAIISALGNDVDMQTSGTRFDYADYKLHTEWNLDDEVSSFVGKALAGRFTVKAIKTDPHAFANAKPGVFEGLWSILGNRVVALPGVSDVDAVVLIVPDTLGANSGDSSAGLIVNHAVPILFGKAKVVVSARYLVVVYNAKTGDKIDYASGQLDSSNPMLSDMPFEYCTESLWANSEDKLTDSQMNGIHQELWSLLARSLGQTLGQMNLISASDATSLSASVQAPGDPSCQIH